MLEVADDLAVPVVTSAARRDSLAAEEAAPSRRRSDRRLRRLGEKEQAAYTIM